MSARRLIAVLLIASALMAVPAHASHTSTTIGFDEPGYAGQELGSQYASAGVTFTTCGFNPFGEGPPSPNRIVANAVARSAPNLVEVTCGVGPSFTRTLSASFSSARTRVGAWVRSSNASSPQVTMTGFDENGSAVASGTATATPGGWTELSISQPAGETPRIASVRITSSGFFRVDDFSFDIVHADGGGGGGGAPPPESGDRPAAASFTASSLTPRALERVRFDASPSAVPGSRPTAYHWDVTGDGQTDATCGPETPVLATDFPRAGSRTVTLNVSDTTGTTTTASQTLTISRRTSRSGSGVGARAAQLRRRQRAAINRAVAGYTRRFVRAFAPAVCRPVSDVSGVDVTGLGGPGAGCISELQIPDTRVAAVGCLEEKAYAELPGAERSIIDNQILEYFRGNSQLGNFERGCRVGCPGGARARAAITPVEAALLLRRARQVLAGAARFYVADSAVRVNGLDYTPDPVLGAGQSHIVLIGPGMIGRSQRGGFPGLVSSGVTITAPTDVLGAVQLRRKQRIVLPIDTNAEIANFSLTRNVPFAEETNLRGRLTAVLQDKASDLNVQLALPPIFSKPGGGPVTGSVTLRATNRGGIHLAGFEVRNINAEIFGIGVFVEYLRFQADPDPILEGKARVSFLPVGEIEGEIAVRNGALEFLDVAYLPGPPGIKVAPAIFIYEVGGGFEDTAEVTRIFGRAGLAAGGTIGGGCAPVGVLGGFDFRIDPKPVTLTVTGDMELACIEVASQSFTLAADGYASFTAGLNDFDLGLVKLTANWGATFYDGNFTAEGTARAEVETDLGDFGINGTALLSDKGISMCAGVDVLGAEISVGFGLDWWPPPVNVPALLSNLSIMAPSCDVGPWRTIVARPRAAQAEPATIDVAEGQRAAVIGVVGADGAPRVTLRSPDGRTIEMPPAGTLRQNGVLAFRVPEQRTTYVVLARPAPGTWTIEPQDGARITEVRRAPVLPEPQVQASVRRRGGAQLVDYRVRPIPGQVVHLLEEAPGGTRELGVVNGRRFEVAAAARGSVRQVAGRRDGGTLRVTPSDASGSRRAIVALVEQDGLPRERITLDRFQAGPPRIGRARRIRGRRSRSGRLTISWGRARGAERHLVGVELSDGRALTLRPRPRARRVTIPGVRRGTRVTVRVIGARAEGARRGPAARARFRAR